MNDIADGFEREPGAREDGGDAVLDAADAEWLGMTLRARDFLRGTLVGDRARGDSKREPAED